MNVEDFIKLSPVDAGQIYRRLREDGEAEQASRLHQAFYEAHRVKLSDERQTREQVPDPSWPVAPTGRQNLVPQVHERSKVRLVGALVSALGFALGIFAAAAGAGLSLVIVGLGLSGAGFALWLTGVIEDRLLSIEFLLGASTRPSPSHSTLVTADLPAGDPPSP